MIQSIDFSFDVKQSDHSPIQRHFIFPNLMKLNKRAYRLVAF